MPFIPIPHVTQRRLPYVNLCGQACVTMLARAYNRGRPSVEDVARASGTWDNTTSSIAEVTRQADAVGLTLDYTRHATTGWYHTQIALGYPVIALIDLGKLPARPSVPHFVVVLGTDSGDVILNDPLLERGGYRVTVADFERAIASNRYNLPYQALIPRDPLVSADASAVLRACLDRASGNVTAAQAAMNPKPDYRKARGILADTYTKPADVEIRRLRGEI